MTSVPVHRATLSPASTEYGQPSPSASQTASRLPAPGSGPPSENRIGRGIPGIAVLAAVATASLISCAPQRPAPVEPVIIAYAAGGGDRAFRTIDATKLTHINYAFAKIREGRITQPRPRDQENLDYLRSLRDSHPHLRLLLSVGGWGAEGFSDAAFTAESRKTFANSVAAYVAEHDLDGADLDWEYPGQPGAGNVFRAEDRENFTLMLAAVRDALDRTAETSGRSEPYLLTVATGASQTYLDHTQMGEAQKYLDFVNIMTYDFSGSWTDTVWHHTNVRASSAPGASGRGMDLAVQQHMDAGVPASKIVVGAAFYGRGWAGVAGLNEPASDSVFSLGYHEVAGLLDDPAYERLWDEDSQAPYVWNPDTGTFVTYDDTVSIRLKAEFVRENGLAGAMFWQYGSDTTGVLVTALHEGLR
jgi:chitinase